MKSNLFKWQIVAGPRLRHPEARLDLCYVTDETTSGPSSTYPQRAYRNPTDALVRFLDLKHGENWAIWEFRAEGTGYPDKEVYGRIHHFPWPDHHPPPFSLIPPMMANALKQFTERRMRVGFGPGVSIPSQVRYVGYVDRWANKYNKKVRRASSGDLGKYTSGAYDMVLKVQVERLCGRRPKNKMLSPIPSQRTNHYGWRQGDAGKEPAEWKCFC
ncbi:hypothetical protein CISG_09850 [Coccidioides immitis RMSCC 3703]|uniref:Phosphatase tensin-type domain-containing protein n=1 Tax=Coccidioides immitis RMSCC 3703 TaxID=454286 RepID=A0A0J8QKC8_COCIT|nr:hypothetical protein CISG_09850 [Coccidioides immitis RMSCC 3703]